MSTSFGTAGGFLSRCTAALSLVAALTLPAPLALAADEDIRYVVRPGDNPWNLTQRYLRSIDYWPRLQKYNRIEQPNAIPPGTVLRIPVAWLRGEPATVRVSDLNGAAELRRDGETTPLARDMTLSSGAVIRTGEETSVVLEFPDGSRSRIGEDSEVRVTEVRQLNASDAQQIELQLLRGRLENDVEPVGKGGGRFRIRTPAGVAAVRGTEFRVAASDGGARAETVSGEVSLSNPRGDVRLRAGTGSMVVPGRAPERASALLAAPQLGTLPERVERLPFALPFPVVAGALRYRTQLAPRDTAAAVTSDQVGSAPEVPGHAELGDGNYVMRVRAIDERGLEGLDARREIVVDARPEPPFPTLPVQDGVVVDDRIAFGWTRSVEPGQYHFQLAADETFGTLLADSEHLDEPGVALDIALAPGRYFWRVALTTAPEGHGPFSDVQRLRRPPPGPSAEAPQARDGRLELRWRGAGESARYELQFAREADFAAPDFSVETRDAVLSIETPPPGTYYVRIRSFEPDGAAGPWGKPQQFVVPANHWRALVVLLPLLFAL
ncbi:FecR domain-containing protein [Aromatoleum sp.]|uniref:FecR domain-containing protein n=1 Tax=Aromatoleum sp. TaxID=2307007 RepID=UPI002FC8CF71